MWYNLRECKVLNGQFVQYRLEYNNELEKSGFPETRSHNIGYRSRGGRTILAQSPTSHDSVLGERDVDNALDNISRHGVGQIGNFFWWPSSVNPANNNPLQKEIHTIIVGNKSRINFTTPNKKEDIEYVLSRVRALS